MRSRHRKVRKVRVASLVVTAVALGMTSAIVWKVRNAEDALPAQWQQALANSKARAGTPAPVDFQK